jgi:hypothetical protein
MEDVTARDVSRNGKLGMAAWLGADGDLPDLTRGIDAEGRIVRESLALGHGE